ncbi:hypothetical protein KC325_g222 [Hortaea werneckii]|nr:hypothetical protein KC325_g222 [Hortaea werneckii]
MNKFGNLSVAKERHCLQQALPRNPAQALVVDNLERIPASTNRSIPASSSAVPSYPLQTPSAHLAASPADPRETAASAPHSDAPLPPVAASE